ncbi:MAG: helix-turn-helix transcriptional regulator [Hyphomicrobiales bacterium]|nr:helix-turn-helix transcriptional regulator [Hyphomicrobiales bacterium]
MTTRDTFKHQLRRVRKLRDLSQEKLAAKANRSVEAISNLERGLNLPSFDTLEELATALNVPVRDFFEFEDENSGRSTKLTELLNAARMLDDTDLSIAVTQIYALRDKNPGF